MKLRWGRLVAGAVVAEVVPILVLVALVAVFGPPEQAEAQRYAARLGRWVGPLVGAGMCFILAGWVAGSERSLALRYGLALGALTAIIDLGILAASGTTFGWLFAVSNAGRVLAGMLGGAWVARRASA